MNFDGHFEVFDIPGKGRGLKAVKTINTGDVVLEETPRVCLLGHKFQRRFCSQCFRPNHGRLLRCSGCKFVKYCDQQCQKKAWKTHKKQCKRISEVAPLVPADLVRFMFKILEMKAENQDMSWYEDMVSNVDQITEQRKEEFVVISAVLAHFAGYDFIKKFSSPEILELFAKISCNSFSLCDGEMQSIGVGIYSTASKLNHSCNPNCVAVFESNRLTVRAVKKVKNGEELTISYIELLAPKKVRQKELKQQYFFDCHCEKCLTTEDENFYLCVNKSCDNMVSESGKCTKCGNNRDAKQISDICKHSESILNEVRQMEFKTEYNKMIECCEKTLKQQEDILHPFHYLVVGLLDKSIDGYVMADDSDKALGCALRTLEPYRYYYHPYHPNIGMQLFRIGKLQTCLNILEPGVQSLERALDILRVTHGENHPTVHYLKQILGEASEEYRQLRLLYS